MTKCISISTARTRCFRQSKRGRFAAELKRIADAIDPLSCRRRGSARISQRDRKTFDMWMACHTQEEIAEASGYGQDIVSDGHAPVSGASRAAPSAPQWLEPAVGLSLVEEESLRSLISPFMERLAANAKIRQKL
jgi:hypothetical protein